MARTLRSVILRLSLFAHLYNGEAFLHDLFHIYNRSKQVSTAQFIQYYWKCEACINVHNSPTTYKLGIIILSVLNIGNRSSINLPKITQPVSARFEARRSVSRMLTFNHYTIFLNLLLPLTCCISWSPFELGNGIKRKCFWSEMLPQATSALWSIPTHAGSWHDKISDHFTK